MYNNKPFDTGPNLIDSHCHLNFDNFAGELENVVARARDAGVRCMLTICTKLSEFEKLIEITESFDEIFCSVGVHPHEVVTEGIPELKKLIEFTQHPKVVGVGETGLDYFYDNSPKDLQRESFKLHIRAAQETNLPVIVHSRDADQDTGDILESFYNQKSFLGVLHCFTAGAGLAWRAIDLGLYISLSGIITFNNATGLREIVKSLPLDRLLVETDSPYLAPVPMRGKRNEPAFVRYTNYRLAECLSRGELEISDITTQNFFNLFKKVPEAGSPYARNAL